MKREFEIPCPHYLRVFAERHFFDGMTPPFKVTERDLIGKQIFSLLIDQRSMKISRPLVDTTEVLNLQLSHALAKRSPDLVKLSRLTRWLDEYFKMMLYNWVIAQTIAGQSRHKAAKSFFRFHSIADDTAFETHYIYVKRKTNSFYLNHRYGKAKFLET